MHTAEKPGEGSVLTRQVCWEGEGRGEEEERGRGISADMPAAKPQGAAINQVPNRMVCVYRTLTCDSCPYLKVLSEYAGLYHQLTEVAGVKVGGWVCGGGEGEGGEGPSKGSRFSMDGCTLH